MKVTGRPRLTKRKIEIESIPRRPPGFFADASSPAEIQEDNLQAKASVVSAPRDLE
jgi:hypothetical protein